MPPAIISASETETWAMMNPLRSRYPRTDDVPTHLTIELSAERELSIAGDKPNKMPATKEMARTYPKTWRSGLTFSTRVHSAGRTLAALVTATSSNAHVASKATQPA